MGTGSSTPRRTSRSRPAFTSVGLGWGSRCGVGVDHEAQGGVRPSGVGADVRRY